MMFQTFLAKRKPAEMMLRCGILCPQVGARRASRRNVSTGVISCNRMYIEQPIPSTTNHRRSHRRPLTNILESMVDGTNEVYRRPRPYTCLDRLLGEKGEEIQLRCSRLVGEKDELGGTPKWRLAEHFSWCQQAFDKCFSFSDKASAAVMRDSISSNA